MPSINAYLHNLRKIRPTELDPVLDNHGIGAEARKPIYEAIYQIQRNADAKDMLADDLAHVDGAEFEEGRWIESSGLSGKLTDAHFERLGVAQEQRVTVVVDGKIHMLDSDAGIVLYQMPYQPEEVDNA